MADSAPSLAELLAEEDELQFSRFTNDDAWQLGAALVEVGRRQSVPIAIDISRNGQQLFHSALAGTAADNDGWIRRKTAVVNRFGHSTLYVRQSFLERGTTFEADTGLDPRQYAAHGGGFPILVREVGPVGVVVVSGLPQLDDHRFVVAAVRAHLGG
jgi:uncharacterized protein (UPF0303 family)